MNLCARERGYSLLELLVAVGMIGIVSAASVSFLLTQRTFQRSTELRLETRQGLQGALDMLSRDARLAGVCLPKTGPFSAMTGTDIGALDTITLRIGNLLPNLDCVRASVTGFGVAAGATQIPVDMVAGFGAGDRVYIGSAGAGEFGRIASVDGTGALVLETGVTNPYLAGTRIDALTQRAYTVATDSADFGTQRQSLMLSIDGATAQPVAVGITALNVRYELSVGCPGSCVVVDAPTAAEWQQVRSVLLSVTSRAARAPGAGQPVHVETATIRLKPRNYTTL